MDRAIGEIQAQVRETESGNLGETPVKLASVVQRLGAGAAQDKIVLGQILDTLVQLRGEMRVVVQQAEQERVEKNPQCRLTPYSPAFATSPAVAAHQSWRRDIRSSG